MYQASDHNLNQTGKKARIGGRAYSHNIWRTGEGPQ